MSKKDSERSELMSLAASLLDAEEQWHSQQPKKSLEDHKTLVLEFLEMVRAEASKGNEDKEGGVASTGSATSPPTST